MTPRTSRPWCLAVVVLLVAVPVAFGQEGPAQEAARAAARRAEALRRSGPPKEAIAAYESALARMLAAFGDGDASTAGVMHDLAQLYSDAGQYDKAEPLLRQALAVAERLLGKDDVRVGIIVANQAILYGRMRQFDQAVARFGRALAIYEARLGRDHFQVGSLLGHLGVCHEQAKQLDKAEVALVRCLEIGRKHATTHPADLIVALNNLATFYQREKRLAEAEPLYRECLRRQEAIPGHDPLDVATIAGNLGLLYVSLGRRADAEGHLNRALRVHQERLPRDHLRLAHSHSHLADLRLEQGRFGEAETHFRESLRILERNPMADPSEVNAARMGLALLNQHLRRLPEAEELYLQCLAAEERRGDEEAMATVVYNLGAVYKAMGRYGPAEAHFQRALRLREGKPGSPERNVAHTLGMLAELYTDLGQYERALPLLERTLRLQEADPTVNPRDQAVTRLLLASLFRHLGQPAKAEDHCRRAQALQESLAKDHQDLSHTLNELGLLHAKQGRFREACSCYLRSLEIDEKYRGKNSTSSAATLSNLAGCHEKAGEYAHAEPLYLRCWSILEAAHGPDHPGVVDCLNNLAVLHAAEKQWPQVLEVLGRARPRHRRHLAQVLPGLSETEQLTFLNSQRNLSWILSLGLHRPNDAATVERTAEWLLNDKAVAQEALAERALLARDGGNPTLAALARDLQQTRTRLSRLALATPPPGHEAELRRQREQLAEREQDLSKQLGRAGGTARPEPWVNLSRARAALPKGSRLVLMARMDVRAHEPKPGQLLWRPARYVAWVVPPAGEAGVALVDLGEATKVEAAVQAVRRAMADAPRLLGGDEIAAERAILVPLRALADLVLAPLRPQLDQAERWFLSPDGDLWLVPWSALPWKEGEYVVEKHTLSYLVSGRELGSVTATVTGKAPLIFANPDYDAAGAPAAPNDLAPAVDLAGRRLRGTVGDWKVSFAFGSDGRVIIHDEDAGGEIAGEGRWSLRGTHFTLETPLARFVGRLQDDQAVGERTLDGKKDRWQFRLPLDLRTALPERPRAAPPTLPTRVTPLPATAAEAEAAAPSLARLTGQQPAVHFGRAASEAALKAVRQPRVLVLATHGYFLPAPAAPPPDDRNGPPLGKPAPVTATGPLDHPLLRCGLLLAGYHERGRVAADAEDGVLTGLEIVGLDLRGCDLVVLSACETALGDVHHGEGVSGLRQAFQLAGARAVVATLWQVADRETARLMTAFFDKLASGRSVADTLHEAQRERLRARRERFGAGHPFYWAACTLTDRGP